MTKRQPQRGNNLCSIPNGNEIKLCQERNRPPRRGWGIGGTGGYKDFAPDGAATNRNAVEAFSPSVGRRSRATLGCNTKMKTTLKELWRGGGGLDATPFSVDEFAGTVFQGRRSSPVRLGLPTLG